MARPVCTRAIAPNIPCICPVCSAGARVAAQMLAIIAGIVAVGELLRAAWRWLVPVLALLLLSSCVTSRPPITTPPGIPHWDLDVQVSGESGGIAGAEVVIADSHNKGKGGTADASGHLVLHQLEQAGFTICAKAEGYTGGCGPVTLIGKDSIEIQLTKVAPVNTLKGRLRTASGGFVNDVGPVRLVGISEFDLVWQALTGHQDIVRARLDKAKAANLTFVRVLGMASILFHLTPDDPGYDAAVAYVLAQAASRGLYVEFVIFADAQILYPSESVRQALLARVVKAHNGPGVLWAVANEAFKNGWQEADDPKILALAETLAGLVGHRDFVISDPVDGDNPDVSAQTLQRSITIARHTNIVVIHDSRKGGSAPSDGRWRRWVAHLESFADLVSQVKSAVGHDVSGIHEEPMGAASVCTATRECDGDAMLAGTLTGVFSGIATLYHYIAIQDPATPGLDNIGAVLARVPVSGHYLNDCIGDSPSCGFSGWDKVRWWITGNSAVGIAYGATPGAIKYRGGWHETGTLYSGPHARVIQVAR